MTLKGTVLRVRYFATRDHRILRLNTFSPSLYKRDHSFFYKDERVVNEFWYGGDKDKVSGIRREPLQQEVENQYERHS